MKYVFILPSHANTNHIKRIEEFVSRGYEVEVYTFYRDRNRKNFTSVVPFKSIGEIDSNLPYWKRIGIIRDGIKMVLNNTKNEACIYYLIRNDIALIYTFITHRPYIFEEADMTHLDFNIRFICVCLEYRIKKIIRKSVLSVFRSEGFLKYHFGDNYPSNTFVIPNRLHPDIVKFSSLQKKTFEISHIRFAFVGAIRFKSIFYFSEYILKNFPHHQVHFYGICVSDADRLLFEPLKRYSNCFFHGEFKSPDELPRIYANIDIVFATYDNWMTNTKYAEPNKLYEAIFFETPIIVSKNTFLAEKVKKMNVGFELDACNEKDVVDFVNGLNEDVIVDKIVSAKKIPKRELINKNDDFFKFLDSITTH